MEPAKAGLLSMHVLHSEPFVNSFPAYLRDLSLQEEQSFMSECETGYGIAQYTNVLCYSDFIRRGTNRVTRSWNMAVAG